MKRKSFVLGHFKRSSFSVLASLVVLALSSRLFFSKSSTIELYEFESSSVDCWASSTDE